MRRSIKTKVRATSSELLKLHEIADTNKTPLATLLRDSTLNRDFSKKVVVGTDDLSALNNVVGQFQKTGEQAVFLIDALMPAMSAKGKEISDCVDAMKVTSDAIISKLKKKREKIAATVITLMEDNADMAIYDYMDTYEHRDNDLIVSCTIDEIKEIRRKADMAGVTISCLLKTNAFEYNRYGTVTIQSEDVFPLVKELNAKIASLNSVIEAVKTRKVMKNDIRELKDITQEGQKLLAAKRKDITLSVAGINREAKNILKATRI